MTTPPITPAKLQQLVRQWSELWRQLFDHHFNVLGPVKHGGELDAIERQFRTITPDLARAATERNIRCSPLFDFSGNVRGADERTADPAWSLVKELATHCPDDPIDTAVKVLHTVRSLITNFAPSLHDLDLHSRDVRLGYVTQTEQIARDVQQYESQVVRPALTGAIEALLTLNKTLSPLPFIELIKPHQHRRGWDVREAIKACAQWADPRFRGFETNDPRELPQVYAGALSAIIDTLCAIEVPDESMATSTSTDPHVKAVGEQRSSTEDDDAIEHYVPRPLTKEALAEIFKMDVRTAFQFVSRTYGTVNVPGGWLVGEDVPGKSRLPLHKRHAIEAYVKPKRADAGKPKRGKARRRKSQSTNR